MKRFVLMCLLTGLPAAGYCQAGDVQSDSDFTAPLPDTGAKGPGNSIFSDDDDMINYTRFFIEPAFRVKGTNTDKGIGIDAGILGLHDKSGPGIGLSAGYYQFDSRTDSNCTYKIVPVMLRATGDFTITPGGVMLSAVAEGGYGLNNYNSGSDAVRTAIDNSYVLAAQLGLKFPVAKNMSASLRFGYQYLNPKVSVTRAGVKEESYVDLGAGFVKFALEF